MSDRSTCIAGEIYEYKGNRYRILSCVKMKHPETRDWIHAVCYQSEETGGIYVRDEHDFGAKFRRPN